MLPFNFNDYWAGVAVDDFKIHIELAINLTPPKPSNEISIPLLGSSGLDIPFNVKDCSSRFIIRIALIMKTGRQSLQRQFHL
jgi:hypothetical protein